MYIWALCVLFFVNGKMAYTVTSYVNPDEEIAQHDCEDKLLEMARKTNQGFHAYCARVPKADPT